MRQVKATATSVLAFFVNPPGEHTLNSGLIILDDNGDTRGIKSRYFEVHDVGSRTEVADDVKKGDIVLVAHGRWSRGFNVDDVDGRKLYALDAKDIMGIYEGDVSRIE